MNDVAWLQNYLMLGAVLFAIGLTGFLVRRNLIIMFLCVEMMLQGVSLTLSAWSQYHDNWNGQLMVVFIIAVAACEAGIALALVLMLGRASGSLDVTVWQRIRESGVEPYVDREVPEELTAEPTWPALTPAGVEPTLNPRDQGYRSHV